MGEFGKKKTYDVPAYKVGILVIRGEDNINHTIKDYQRAIAEKKITIVPFEDVDGLTISEVQELLKTKEIMLQFYHQYQTWMLYSNNRVDLNQGIYLKSYIYVGDDILEENLLKPIDQVIENTIEELYDTFDSDQRRAAHCFFERYQDKKYKLTKQRIKRLQNEKN